MHRSTPTEPCELKEPFPRVCASSDWRREKRRDRGAAMGAGGVCAESGKTPWVKMRERG